MRIELTRERKIILLRWLKQNFINTNDLPEAYKDFTLFEALMMEEVEDGE